MEGFKVVEKTPNILWVSKEKIEDRIDCNPYKVEYMEKEKVLKENLPYQTMEQLLRSSKDLTGGATPLGANYLNEGVRFIRTQNVERNYIDLKDVVYISEEDNKKLKRSILQENDILLTITGADFGRIAPVTKECLPANINQHSVRIHFKENIDPYYVSVFLNSIYGQSQIFRYSVGATRSAIDYTSIKNIKIPISSAEIQKYIGDKVRKAQKLREEAKRLKKDAEDILIAEIYINQILEESNSINKKYMWVNNCDVESRIDSEYYSPEYLHYKEILKNNNVDLIKINEIAESIKTGTTPKSEYLTEEVQKVLFLRVNNIGDSIINKKDMLYLKNNCNGEKIKFTNKNDILVSIAGTIGRSAVVDFENCMTNQNVASITLNNSCNVNPYYLSMYMNSYAGKISLERTSTQATVKYINNELLGDIEIPVINLEKQKEIEKKVLEYKDKKEKSEKLIQEAKQDVEDLIEGNFDKSKLN